MLTFNVILGYQGLLFRDFFWVFFFLGFFFNPTDRPNIRKLTGANFGFSHAKLVSLLSEKKINRETNDVANNAFSVQKKVSIKFHKEKKISKRRRSWSRRRCVTLGPFIRGKIRRELYHLYEHVLSKTRRARMNGSRLISVPDSFSCECCP